MNVQSDNSARHLDARAAEPYFLMSLQCFVDTYPHFRAIYEQNLTSIQKIGLNTQPKSLQNMKWFEPKFVIINKTAKNIYGSMHKHSPQAKGFGRRSRVQHAWAREANGYRTPCIIRRLSEDGALLEFQGAVPRCLSFRLETDKPGQVFECEVVHWQGGALGVRFNLFRKTATQAR